MSLFAVLTSSITSVSETALRARSEGLARQLQQAAAAFRLQAGELQRVKEMRSPSRCIPLSKAVIFV